MECISIKNRINILSIHYYNKGIDDIIIKDISSAIANLRMSLKYNKKNINSRNLLGLVYCLIGEYVKGMSQWIISVNLKEYNNIAVQYLKEIRNDEEGLKRINKNIFLYNNIIDLIQYKKYDLSIIQLYKLIGYDNSWIRPRVLLGLLLLKHGRFVKSRSIIAEVINMDKGCKLAKKILSAIDRMNRNSYDNKLNKCKYTLTYKIGNETIVNPKRFFINNKLKLFIILSIVFLIGWLLFIPAFIKSTSSKNNETIINLQSQISALKDDKIFIEKEKLNEVKKKEFQLKKQKKYLNMLKYYHDKIKEGSYDSNEVVNCLNKIDVDILDDKDKELYNSVLYSVSTIMLKENAYNGYNAYIAGNYKDCIKYYQKVVKLNPKYYNGTCLYQLASSYAKINNKDNAINLYKQFLSFYPNSAMASLAKQYINENSK